MEQSCHPPLAAAERAALRADDWPSLVVRPGSFIKSKEGRSPVALSMGRPCKAASSTSVAAHGPGGRIPPLLGVAVTSGDTSPAIPNLKRTPGPSPKNGSLKVERKAARQDHRSRAEPKQKTAPAGRIPDGAVLRCSRLIFRGDGFLRRFADHGPDEGLRHRRDGAFNAEAAVGPASAQGG
jgi:hypothetical protein